MASYKNGRETKGNLYESAKRVFFHNGYNEAMIKDIVAMANAKLGLFSYYFGSKEALAISIYKDFVSDVVFAAEEAFEDIYTSDDQLLKECVEYMAYFQCLTSGEEIRRFYCEISSLPSFPAILYNVYRYFIDGTRAAGIEVERNYDIDDDTYFNAIASLSTGMEINFLSDILSGNIALDYGAAVELLMFEYYGMLLKDKSPIGEKLKKARDVLSGYRFETNEVFEVKINKR